MALPDLIEIAPLSGPVVAEITVPGSKSITNRALVLAALADGETTLQGALWSEDTQVMVDCLRDLGFMVNVAPDPAEVCNRTITVYGQGGQVPRGGTPENPLELFVGNAGTAARFLAAMVCLGDGVYRLHGEQRMHERPQAALFAALRELGYRVESPNDKLPAVIQGSGWRPGTCRVSIAESSQFASALLLCAKAGGWDLKVLGENAEESPYVEMTKKLLGVFPKRGGAFQVEPDASSGSYFWAAGTLEEWGRTQQLGDIPCRLTVRVSNWPDSGWQIDQGFPSTMFAIAVNSPSSGGPLFKEVISKFGSDWMRREEVVAALLEGTVPLSVSRRTDLGDSVMTAITMAPLSCGRMVFTDLGRLRLQECERVAALRTELTKCGAKVVETGDTLEVLPSELHGAEIETYNDHRMAMCFAILGLKVPGIKLQNPACVKKTFPNFFQKLAAPPPGGLGAEIRDGHTGRRLGVGELFAD